MQRKQLAIRDRARSQQAQVQRCSRFTGEPLLAMIRMKTWLLAPAILCLCGLGLDRAACARHGPQLRHYRAGPSPAPGWPAVGLPPVSPFSGVKKPLTLHRVQPVRTSTGYQTMGNHRFSFTIPTVPSGTEAVNVSLLWRRSDLLPLEKDTLVLCRSTGVPVSHCARQPTTTADHVCTWYRGDGCEDSRSQDDLTHVSLLALILSPDCAQDIYDIYYMPFEVSNGMLRLGDRSMPETCDLTARSQCRCLLTDLRVYLLYL